MAWITWILKNSSNAKFSIIFASYYSKTLDYSQSLDFKISKSLFKLWISNFWNHFETKKSPNFWKKTLQWSPPKIRVRVWKWRYFWERIFVERNHWFCKTDTHNFFKKLHVSDTRNSFWCLHEISFENFIRLEFPIHRRFRTRFGWLDSGAFTRTIHDQL